MGSRRPRPSSSSGSTRKLIAFGILAVFLYFVASGRLFRRRNRNARHTLRDDPYGNGGLSRVGGPNGGVLRFGRESDGEGESSGQWVLSEEAERKVRERAKAAILGAFVADAASMGLHWIYDTGDIASMLARKNILDKPEFFEPPSSPFYKYESGHLSPYGDEALPLLESMVEQGGVDPQHLSKHLFEAFKAYKGYLNSASQKMVDNVEAGKQFPDAGAIDDQAHAMVKAPLVVGRYAGSGKLKDKMIDAIKVHQNHANADKSGVAVALILEKVLLGESISDVLKWALESEDIDENCRKWLRDALGGDFKSVEAAIGRFGQSCHLPGSFQGPLYIAQNVGSYVEAVRENIKAGGDSCSRAHLVGALFAAQDGMDAIPQEWREKTLMYTDLENFVDDLLERRPSKHLKAL